MKTLALSTVLAVSVCLLAEVNASAQQPPTPASQQDDRTASPALQARENEPRPGTQKESTERDDPRARIEAQRAEHGTMTTEFKQHLLRQRQQQIANRRAPEANIVATSGPQWVPIGPTNTDYEQNGSFTGFVIDSGRARAILPDPADANTVYFLTSGGGLWKTSNFLSNPPTWTPLTDNLVSTSGGSVAFGRTSSVLYLGLGDPFDVINVAGVMVKSIDGGATWTNTVDLGTPFSVRDVKVDTTQAQDIVLVATDQGLFRSIDAGVNYSSVPGPVADPFAGKSFWSIVNTSAGWLASAQSCGFQPAVECGTTSTLYVSTDHGATWAAITNAGTVFAGAGRTTLGAGPGAANNVVYAFSENTSTGGANDQRGLFRSTDGGQTWVDLGLNALAPTNPNSDNTNMDLMHNQAWYNQMMLVDPSDAAGNTIYLGGNLSSAKSTDHGQTWTLLTNWLYNRFGLPYAHADFHAAAFSNISGTKRLFFGSDGGLFTSTDGGSTWDNSKNQGLQTFLVYTLSSTPGFPSEVMIGTQDNGTRVRKGATNTYNQSRGGDGVGTGMSQANTNTSITSVPNNSYATNITNQTPDTLEAFNFTLPPLVSDAVFHVSIATPSAAADPSGKVFFTYSGKQVYKTTDGGLTWTVIGIIGGATNTIPATITFRALVHGIGVSPVDLLRIGVIAASGNVTFTTNGGTTWTASNINSFIPTFLNTSSFTWADNSTMYVTSVTPQAGAARIAKSIDGGATWARADGGLPDVPVNRLIVDPRDATKNTLLAASLEGVFRSTDGGATWNPYGTGLSNAYVNDLYMPPDGSFLRMGSYGRGVWELPFLMFNSAALTDDVAACDHDGVLDNGETGTLSVTLHNDGGTALNSITATVTSTNPAVSFPSGSTIVFPAAAAGASTTGTVPVSLNGASGIQQIDFTISYNDPSLSLPGPVKALASFRANDDEKPGASANDNIEAQTSAWIVTGTAASLPDSATWERRTISPVEHRWGAYNSSTSTDVQLVSPTLQVGGGTFTVSYEQRYLFDFSGANFFAGMVLEVSQDGGATWADVGAGNLTPTYDHTLVNSPLLGRLAYSGQSAAYPNFTPVTLNLGTTLAGKSVKLRFRVGSIGGGPGVEIRNITTTGLTNTPFSAVVTQTPCATTTALTSSLNPSVFGNNVTFTATVAGGPSVATGNVTFADGATTLGTSALDVTAKATFATTTLTVGTHSITASYVGDSSHAASVSPAVSQVVNSASLPTTTTAVASSANPSTFGQSVTFTATVTSGAAGTPTGTVTFKDGATTLGTGALNGSAVATFSTGTLAVGSHTITAVYAGDASFAGSTGSLPGNPQVVNKDNTTAAVTSSLNPSVFGQSVTFTATVSAVAPGAGIATGTVTFLDGASSIGTGALNGAGVATLSTSALAVGSHTITASYGGDGNFNTSTGSLTGNPQVVNKANSTTAVTSSLNPSVFGQSVTFTATVTAVAPGAGIATGTVTFLDGASSIGTGALNGAGVATLTTSALAVGSHTITANYGGSGSFNSSTGSLTGNPQVVNKANTGTALASSVNPSVFGQSVTFTATVTAVAPGAGTATGTVTFLDGASSIGTGALNGAGVATLTTSALAVGSHTITANYGGSSSFNSSTGSLTGNPQVVNKDNTATAVTSSVNPSVFGQSVTFTATVSPVAPGAGSPTGTVTFLDGGASIGTGTLSAGVATFSSSVLAIGNHTITTSYGGDGNFNASTGSLTGNPQVVGKDNTATAVTSSVNPSVFGQPVTFTATVSAVAPGAGTPTGTVTFLDGGASIGTGALNGTGVATLTTSALAVGSHTITTSYGGDGNFNVSTGSLTGNPQVVGKDNTTTALTSSVNPSVFGQSVTFTATVSPVAPGTGTPTGTVTFLDGGSSIGTGALNGAGVATLTTSALAIGNHTITTSYGGSASFNASTGSLTGNPQVVGKANTATAVTSSANPSVFGQPVTFTATISAVAPGTGTPTGTVTFLDGGASIGTGTLSAGAATFVTSALAIGNHTITTSYGGDGNFNASTGSLTGNPQVVNKANTNTALISSVNPSASGQSVTFTATVTATAPGAGIPTTTVTFKDGAATLGTGALNASGVATFATSTLANGSHSITAVYAGDGNFNTSTSNTVTQAVNLSATTTAVASSANPSVFGQSVTFTATVTSGAAGTPTGTVTFKDGANTLGTGTLNGSAVATFSSSALTVGSHSITAAYGGDVSFAGSTSSALTQTVNTAATTAVVTSSLNPSTVGQSVTFTATVAAAAPGAGTPTGTVTFKDNGATLGTGALSAGVATFATSALAAGSHPITAVYGGDTNFAGSTSATFTQSVKGTTTTALTSSVNPSANGQSVTFTATVTSPAAGIPTGNVTFKDGATTLGTPVALNGAGVATLTTAALTSGSHSITAVYAGDPNFAGSTSTVLTQTVNLPATTTAIVSSVNPSVFGQSVTFTATVTSGAAGTPTGTVTFKDGANTLGTAPLNGSAAATFTSSTLTTGPHTITAAYGGDANFAGSTSTALTQTVNVAATASSVTSLANPSVFGQSVTFTATVTAIAPAVGTAAGTVTFKDGATTLGTGALNGTGIATFATSTLTVGSHSITAVYGGSANFGGSTSAALTQTINTAATTSTVTSSLNPSAAGQSVTFTATVTPTAPGAGTPTGTVTFRDGAVTLGTGALSAGVATFATTTLTVGSHSITAIYAGDANFATSTAAVVTQVVKGATSTAVTSSVNPSNVGQSVTFTATVTSSAAGTPTGNVIFKDGTTTLSTSALNASGIATFATPTLAAGSHSITAAYAGDANFAASTSTALTQTVNAPDFSVSATPPTQNITAGQSGMVTFTVTPLFGSTQTVTFGCTGLPAHTTCTLVPPSVTLNGTQNATATGTIQTTANAGVPFVPIPQRPQPRVPYLPLTLFALASLAALLATSLSPRQSLRRFAAFARLLIGVTMGLAACSNGGQKMATGTPLGSYNIMVTATATGGATHSAAVTIVVK